MGEVPEICVFIREGMFLGEGGLDIRSTMHNVPLTNF